MLKEANQAVPEDLLKYDEGIVKKKEHKVRLGRGAPRVAQQGPQPNAGE